MAENTQPLADDAPELLAAPFAPCTLEPEPDWPRTLPQFIRPGDLLGFNQATGRMTTSWRHAILSGAPILASDPRETFWPARTTNDSMESIRR